jgi:alkylation response protein AidB-like acyl-CoA dehydrogenase
MDFDLTEEQAGIRQLARDFCDRELAPNARELDRTEAFPEELVPKLVDVGFLGATIPESFGGMGLDYVSYGLIVEECGRTDASIRSMVSVNLGLVASSLVNYGTAEQQAEWLPRLAGVGEGAGLGAFGLTEPDHGSNPNGMTSHATAATG